MIRIAAALVASAFLLTPVLAWAQASTWVRPPTEQDERRAAQWVRFSAENGEPWAQYMLGTMLEFGRAMPADVEAALGWYLKAAEGGDINGQYRAGLLYHAGRGTPRDDDQAQKWVRMAAEGGSAEAQALLGTLYAFGDGVEADAAEAVRWWTKGAEAGSPDAWFNLAAARAHGRGTGTDPAAAANAYAQAAWGFLAAARPDDARRALTALTDLDPDHAAVADLTAALGAAPEARDPPPVVP